MSPIISIIITAFASNPEIKNVVASAAGAAELLLQLPNSSGFVGLSTRGSSAFRVRILASKMDPFETPMVEPDAADAPFHTAAGGAQGITSKGIGTLTLSSAGELSLHDVHGLLLARTPPIVLAATGSSGAHHITFRASTRQKLFGRGGGPGKDGTTAGCRGSRETSELVGTSPVTPRVENCATFVPYYYSSSGNGGGYGALAAVNYTEHETPDPGHYGGTNVLPAKYAPSADGLSVTWAWQGPSLQIYLMPAPSLDRGTASYYALTGGAPVPPLWAFGFTLCRWGWANRSYVEDTLHRFRRGAYPSDAFIMDFGWFTHVSDYAFPPQGFGDYTDFGYHNTTMPEPRAQLAYYRESLHYRFGGIRKPRLGNTALLDEARSLGLLLPGGESGGNAENPNDYAQKRNLNFSDPAARAWYVEHQAHYRRDGVEFFWNDEGETDYFTYHHWNLAQLDGMRAQDASKRFFSLNRAFTPGLARLGAAVWTGDIYPTWEALRNTPALVVNWGLAGMPYVACDIGGFQKPGTTPLLLTRWYQLGSLMPIMRTHSIKYVTPHWPWLWGEPYASAMRQALELRYRLLAYHYSCAHEMATSHTLWMRPLAAEWPDDPKVETITREWLDGPSLLAAPIVEAASNYSTYLPNALWYAFNESTTHQGPVTLTSAGGQGAAALEEIPIFVRAPAVVPVAPLVQHTGELPGGPLEVQVYAADGSAGSAGSASFRMYEDDGETTGYARKGALRTTTFTWDPTASSLSWRVEGDLTAAPRGFSHLYLTLFRDGARVVSAVYDVGTGGAIVLKP